MSTSETSTEFSSDKTSFLRVVRAADLTSFVGKPLPAHLNPKDIASNTKMPTLFLSGPICSLTPTRGSPLWQDTFIEALRTTLIHDNPSTHDRPTSSSSLHLTVFNPVRPDWNSTWPNDNPEYPPLKQQVNWETDALEAADFVVFFFGGGKGDAPVTLLEFGTVMGRDPGRCVVWCEEGYTKKVNVEILAGRKGVKIFRTWPEVVEEAMRRIQVAQDA